MPSINIGGQPPGQPPTGGQNQYTGSYHGTVSDPARAARQAGYSAAEAAQAGTAKPGAKTDYDRAMAQKAAVERSAMAADLRKRRQEDVIYRQRQAVDTRNARAMDKLTRDEIKQRNDTLRQQAREALDARRQQQANERAEIQFQRQQQTAARSRAQQETMLGRQFGNMASRASGNLTPTALRSMDRGSQVFSERVQQFQGRWGRAPNYGGNIADLRGGLGDSRGAFRVQNISRVGGMGQRAAEDRSWVTLAKAEAELNRIEKTLQEQLKFTKSPTERANVQRQENAILTARQQIAAGKEGMSKGTAMMGGAFGTFGMIMANPIVGTAIAATSAAMTAPYVTNKLYESIIGMQKPYMDFNLNTTQAGRAGGFKGSDLEEAILPGGAASFIPGMGRSDRSKMFGLGPDDYMAAWNSTGRNARSVGQITGTAESLRMAYLAPGMSMSENQLGQSLGQAKTLGAVGNADIDRNEYFRKLQGVMILSTSKGVDATKLAQTWSAVMQTSLGSANTNVTGLSDFVARMMTSGAPSMRSGEGIVNMTTAMQQSAASWGPTGEPAANTMVGSFLLRHGNPASEDALRESLGFKGAEGKNRWEKDIVGNPTSRGLLDNYLAAQKAGDVPGQALWLGQLVKGDPETMMRMADESVPAGSDSNVRSRMLAAMTGASPADVTAYTSTHAVSAGAAGTQRGLAPYIPPDVYAAAQKASAATGVPIGQLLALSSAESRNHTDAVSKTGALGAFQVMPGTQKDMERKYADKFSGVTDPVERNAMAGALYYKESYLASMTDEKPSGSAADAMGGYNWGYGKGHMKQIQAGIMPQETREDMDRFSNYLNQFGGDQATNMPMTTLNRGADAQTANLKAAEYIYVAHTLVVDAFTGVAMAATKAAAALDKLGGGNGVSVDEYGRVPPTISMSPLK